MQGCLDGSLTAKPVMLQEPALTKPLQELRPLYSVLDPHTPQHSKGLHAAARLFAMHTRGSVRPRSTN
jgi:hypothetical protein